MQNMRGVEIQKFRAISSGSKTLKELFGENGFDSWIRKHRHLLKEHVYEPIAFLWHEGITFDKESHTFHNDEIITWKLAKTF